MNKDTGGPAFPHGPLGDSFTAGDGHTHHQFQGHPGMELVDWFAGQAMPFAATLINFRQDKADGDRKIACASYDLAEAMLAEKRRREAE